MLHLPELLKQGKKINYQGASGNENFNRYHNVFSSFEVVQVSLPALTDGDCGRQLVQTSGSLRTVFTEPSATLSKLY